MRCNVNGRASLEQDGRNVLTLGFSDLPVTPQRFFAFLVPVRTGPRIASKERSELALVTLKHGK
jgi:hypothetical protein